MTLKNIGIGINYLYWYGLTKGDPYKSLELTARAGADVIEYNAPLLVNMSKTERTDFVKAVKDNGMSIAVTGGMGGSFDLSHPDRAIRESSIELARKALEVSSEVGSKDWCGIIYCKWFEMPIEPLNPHKRRIKWAHALESLKEVTKIAEDCGVDISMEIVNRFEGYLITNVDLGMQFAEEVSSPRMKLLLDTFHMNIEEYDTVRSLKKAISNHRLGHLHAAESNRMIPGVYKTDIKWDDIFKTIRESDYDGTISIEAFVQMETPNAVALATWRNLIDNPCEENMVELMSKGVSFLKDKLQEELQ